MESYVKIELTMDEARNLLSLIDVAVKSIGLQGAEFAVLIAKKIDAASKVSEEEKP